MSLPNNVIIKIGYNGLLNYITSGRSLKFEELKRIAMQRFAIPNKYAKHIEVHDEKGYVFEKDVFECFITIFPVPEIIFYLRVNFGSFAEERQLPNKPEFNEEDEDLDMEKYESRRPFKLSQQHNIRQRHPYAAPLIRQNCFIGAAEDCSTKNRTIVKRRLSYGKATKKRLGRAIRV